MFDIKKLLKNTDRDVNYRSELPDLIEDLISSGAHKSIQLTLTLKSAKLLADDLRYAITHRKLDEDNK